MSRPTGRTKPIHSKLKLWFRASQGGSKAPTVMLVVKSLTSMRAASLPLYLLATIAAGLSHTSPARAVDNDDLACAWPIETTPAKANVAYPDSNATYWTMPFFSVPGLKITLTGIFPDARYFAFDVYGSDTLDFSRTGRSSTLPDYEIQPILGTLNPWQMGGGQRGNYRIVISNGPEVGESNLMPLSPLVEPESLIPLLPDSTGYLMMRVYLPKGGDPNSVQAVELPDITFSLGGNSRTLSPCAIAQSDAGDFGPNGSLGALIRDQLSQSEGGPCQENNSCPPLLGFFRAGGSQTPFPNGISGYVAALYQPAPGYVSVVRAKMPSSSSSAADGPALWPDPAADLRYWSFCNYLYREPFPVIEEDGNAGCIADFQVPLVDQVATLVLSSVADRPPVTLDPAANLTWLPTSSSYPEALEVIAVRNMLAAADFAQSVTNISAYSDLALAASTMGTYYPEMTQCSVASFNAGGVSACFSNPESPPLNGTSLPVPIPRIVYWFMAMGVLILTLKKLKQRPSIAS